MKKFSTKIELFPLGRDRFLRNLIFSLILYIYKSQQLPEAQGA